MIKNVHLVGIGGSGLSAIARLLLESGFAVSGSDQNESNVTRQLSDLGVRVFIGHRAEQAAGAELVIQSSAVPSDNPELIFAHENHIPVKKRSAFLEDFLADKTVIAVAGTHGKTTTTSMIAWLLTGMEQDPGYLIGGVSKNLHNNAHMGKGKYFVIEADEYDNMFLGLHPSLAIITNIEHDHTDIFPTPEDYHDAFQRFIAQVQPGGVLLSSQEIPPQKINRAGIPSRHLTYGMHPQASYQAKNLHVRPNGCYQMDIFCQEEKMLNFLTTARLNVPGEHNVRNALAAIAAVDALGLSADEAARWIEAFAGTERRFEIKGSYHGITFVDDYAHHPTEIQTTLSAARTRFPGRRVIAVWQPHTFSRIQSFYEQYLHAFSQADEVIITEIYAAREQSFNFSAAKLAAEVDHEHCKFIPDIAQTCQYLYNHLKTGDILIVMSAGDAVAINQHLLETFANQLPTASTTSDWGNKDVGECTP